MSTVPKERCPDCDKTIADGIDEADHNTGECGCNFARSLCWRRWNDDVCCPLSPYDRSNTLGMMR